MEEEMKKRLLISLCLLCCSVMLFASGKADVDEEYSYDNPYIATFLSNFVGEGVERTDDTPIGMVLREKFNFVLDYIVDEGAVEEKLAIMLASKDYPDMIWVDNAFLHRYIDAGALLPLDDLLKDAPNYVARYGANFPYMRYGLPEDKLFTFSGDTRWFGPDASYDLSALHYDQDIAVRYDVLEDAGWPQLRNSDDYVDFIVAAQKKNPKTNGVDTIGLSAPFAAEWGLQGISHSLVQKTATYVESGGNKVAILNTTTKQYENMIAIEYTKESYAFFNKLYRAGALDPDIFIDTSAMLGQKINGPNPPIAYWYAMWTHNNVKRAEDPANEKLQFIRLPVQSPTQIKNKEKIAEYVPASAPFGVVLTKNVKHPERVVEIFDYLATDEGAILANTGLEGRHWVRDANGKRQLTDFMKDGLLTGGSAWMDAEGLHFNFLREFGIPVGRAADGQPFALASDIAVKDEFYLTELERDAYKKLGWENSISGWIDPEYAEQAPRLLDINVILSPENAELYAIEERINDWRTKKSAEVIKAATASDFEVLYQEMLDEINKMGAQRVVDWYNQEYAKQAKEIERLKKIKIEIGIN